MISNTMGTKKVGMALLFLFVLTNLMVQLFVTVSPLMVQHFSIDTGKVSLIVTLTTITLGVCSVIYGALSDFVSIKKILVFGISMLMLGSVVGFLFKDYFFAIVIARVLQTAGQGTISAMFLVITSVYLDGQTKIRFFAYFTAAFPLSQSLGVLLGGYLPNVLPWQSMLLIPLVSGITLPIILKYTPTRNNEKNVKIDYIGLLIFSVIIILTTLFLNNNDSKLIFGIALFLIIFLVYINKNDNAFITPSFFRENKKYVKALSVVLITYFSQFSFAFLITFIITIGSGKPISMVPLVLLPGYILSVIVGGMSAKIIKSIGKFNTLLLGMSLVFCGLLGTGILVKSNIITLIFLSILFILGFNIIYSPLISTVTGTLPKDEMGRGIGLNDLLINISGSIGVALTAKIISMVNLPNFMNLSNKELVPYQYAMWLLALTMLLAILLVIRYKKNIFIEK